MSGTTQRAQGYGAYLGREESTGLYCLIINPEAGVTAFACGTAEEVARQGLNVVSPVTSILNAATAATSTTVNVKLSRPGDFSMWFSPIE